MDDTKPSALAMGLDRNSLICCGFGMAVECNIHLGRPHITVGARKPRPYNVEQKRPNSVIHMMLHL